jgi:beta-lactamase regulating signal transducer with metallopeptidase domain
MNNLLSGWLSLSISGTLLALAVLAATPWFRGRISYSYQYGIWILVILRCLFPAAPEMNGMTALAKGASAAWQAVMPEQKANPPATLSPAASTLPGPAPDTEAQSQTPAGESGKTPLRPALEAVPASPGEAAPADSRDWSGLADILQACWLTGAAVMLAWKAAAYRRYRRLLLQDSRLDTAPAVIEMLNLCRKELGIRQAIPVYRSPFVTTPMLMGLLRPAVLLPEGDLDSRELRYMFLHELTHFRRQDLPVKWLVQLAVCLHWFNPAVYGAARHMDRLCELACDEAVVRRMSPTDKQGYGETLIALAASPAGRHSAMLGAMTREGRDLKERLVSIMKSGARKNSARLGVLLLAAAAAAAFFMGYRQQPEVNRYQYGFAQFSIHNVQLGERFTDIDTSPFIEADEATKQSLGEKYQYVAQQIMLKIRGDGRITGIHGDVYENGFTMPYFTMEKAEVSTRRVVTSMSQVADVLGESPRSWYDRGQQLKSARYEDKENGIAVSFVYSSNDDRLVWVISEYISDPGPEGIRSLYPLEGITTYRTPYVGNNSRVSQISGRLPVPHRNFMQRFMALQTTAQPYGLTLYYEAAHPASSGPAGNHGIPLDDPATRFGKVMRSNALVLFSMIDNLGQVTFAFRPDMSGNVLDQEAYPVSYTFHRTDFARYGDLSELGKDTKRLEQVLLDGIGSP